MHKEGRMRVSRCSWEDWSAADHEAVPLNPSGSGTADKVALGFP
jgi:hypothetical protein